MKRSMILPFAVLAGVPFVMVLGNSMLIPVFPQMEQEMGLTQFQVGLLITAFSVPAGILIPFTGALSDYVGRKVIMTPALILYGLGGLVAGTAALLLENPYTAIIVGRVIQGMGAGGTYQIALALTGDLFTSAERTKAVGMLEAANGLGKVTSPILGSLFALIAWFAPFFAYGILSIPVALAVWWIVKEPDRGKKQESVREYLKSLARVFRKKAGSLLACYLAGMAGLFLLFGLLSYLSDVLEDPHGIKGFAKGFVLAIPVGVMAATSYLAGLFLEKRQGLHKPAVLAGLGVTFAAFAALTLFDGLIAMVLLSSVIGLGIGASLPPINTMVTGATDSEERGLVTSLYGTVRFFGVAIGPPTFGLLIGAGTAAMFLGGAGIAAAAGLLAFFLIAPEKMRSGQGKAASEGQRGDGRAADAPRPGPESGAGAEEEFHPVR